MPDPCPYCGELHEPVPDPKNPYSGFPIVSCPEVPEGVWFTEDEQGRGLMFVVEEET